MIQISEAEYERLRREAGFMGSPTANHLIDVADDLETEIAGFRATLPTADGQTVALLEKAAERVSEAARLLRCVVAREGRRAGEPEAKR